MVRVFVLGVLQRKRDWTMNSDIRFVSTEETIHDMRGPHYVIFRNQN